MPYHAPDFLEIAVNGHALRKSAPDGYRTWYADGYMHVQINVPPEKASGEDHSVVTCAYDPKEARSYGFEPPAAVREQLHHTKQGQR